MSTCTFKLTTHAIDRYRERLGSEVSRDDAQLAIFQALREARREWRTRTRDGAWLWRVPGLNVVLVTRLDENRWVWTVVTVWGLEAA